MSTIVGISDYDPLRQPNSRWRNLQVEWDEHGYSEKSNRVSCATPISCSVATTRLRCPIVRLRPTPTCNPIFVRCSEASKTNERERIFETVLR
ncbi:hypothetical protein J5N97_024670 [Dioscorea zingiberensis]|uniref:Auxin response factor domain-containing protein n=1 Tax=Dioscorea zingiberensis TaxID=325984 RepID=A0A9D5C7P9_9LILI|nr:hypothetical protein J5N97_024670 [Dioscorea zingiberensis]